MRLIKAAVLKQLGSSLDVVADIKLPEILCTGQVVVEISLAGICRSQLMEISGGRGVDRWLPHMLGHEGVGTVVDIGPGVSRFKIGDPVIISWIKSEGIDSGGCQLQRSNGEIINAGPATTFSNLSVISENRLVHRPPGLSDKLAVLMGCAIPTGYGMVKSALSDKTVESICIYGFGGIGFSAFLAALTSGAKKIVVFDRSIEQLSLLDDIDFERLKAETNVSWSCDYDRLLEVGGFDFVFESTGSSSGIEHAFGLSKERGGVCVFASHPPHGERISLDPYDFILGRSLYGTWGGGVDPVRDIPLFSEEIMSTGISFDAAISEPYPLSMINEALKAANEPRYSRVLVDVNL